MRRRFCVYDTRVSQIANFHTHRCSAVSTRTIVLCAERLVFTSQIRKTYNTSDKHQNTFQTVFPQFLQPVADIDLGPLAQRLTFCQEQEQKSFDALWRFTNRIIIINIIIIIKSVNVASSTPAQPPGTLFHQTFMTLLIRV